jgi:hypothetical protein
MKNAAWRMWEREQSTVAALPSAQQAKERWNTRIQLAVCSCAPAATFPPAIHDMVLRPCALKTTTNVCARKTKQVKSWIRYSQLSAKK